MKKFNLAALPLAVAGVLASTSAFAGTEACFEVYRGAVNSVVTNHDVLYTPAACEINRSGADVTSLAVNDAATVAWELTGDVNLDLDDIDGAGTLVSPTSHIVYIPTTDVPPASRITMQLTGADFGTANANQLYLVHLDAAGDYQTVASSDGSFDNTTNVEFLTKAGVLIGAGSRLLLSNTNPNGVLEDGTLITGVQVHVANSETCSITPEVTIKAISAFTDAGTVIAGASSSSTGAESILDISEQFALITLPPAVANAKQGVLVDAEDPSFRKSFVNNGQVGGDWANQTIAQKAFWEASFTNKFNTLDLYVTLAPTDTVTVATSADSSTGAGVTLAVLTANHAVDFASLTILDSSEVTHINQGLVSGFLPTTVNLDGIGPDEVALTSTPTNHVAFASEYFSESTGNVSTVNAAVTITNDVTKIMEFNYNVNTSWSMNFTNASYLDKQAACSAPAPFEVGVNGAVLKVPYVYTKLNEGGFVRITSEHNSEATIFMDIFDESSNETKNVDLGLIQPKSSNVLKADDILALAVANGYTGTGDRHTMTFTVTAPKDKVHGVSVQKIAGGVDRVMPVLDQNNWSQ